MIASGQLTDVFLGDAEALGFCDDTGADAEHATAANTDTANKQCPDLLLILVGIGQGSQQRTGYAVRMCFLP